MCAILDASVVSEVFSPTPPEAALKFLDWINTGNGRLVVGGKLLKEISQNSRSAKWARQALNAGLIRRVSESAVNNRTEKLRNEGVCRSDDPHVIALAQLSGARLLYSNDRKLQRDFGTKKLIDSPRGKIYSTLQNKDFRTGHKRLLGRKDLCRIKG